MKDVRLTHVGGRTVLIEAAGWRLLTDPTFDPPGERYSFRRGWERFREDREDIERAHLLVRAAHNGPINALT